ncbi:Squalene synthase [Capsicum annuum]|nr:Squalene synthase [Capsicum annuum]
MEDKVYKLLKALYGLKQAPRAWYSKIEDHLIHCGFKRSENEATLYVKKAKGGDVFMISLYVDDLLVTESNEAMDILKKFKMERCKPISTPLVHNEKILMSKGGDRADPTVYRSLIGSLLYLTATRPDLMFAEEQGQLMGYADCDWAGNVDDIKSTSGYAFIFGSGIFSWNSRKQDVVAKSSAEYIAVVGAANQALWLRKILCDLEQNQMEATAIKVDNKSAISMDKNLVQHGRSKHINVKFHAIGQSEKDGEVNLVYYSSDQHIADILTKALPKGKFEVLRVMLGVSKKNLKEEYKEAIEDITMRMGAGMAKFIYKEVETIDDYDEYCHHVAGIVGLGLSKLLCASGKEDITRDYLEDINEVPKCRMFWPRQIWSKYVNKLEDLKYEENSIKAVQCLNEMVTNALSHVEDCLNYISTLRDPAIFRFCAIPQVMAIGTLAKCYNNIEVFRGVVKIRRGLTAKVIDRTRTKADVYANAPAMTRQSYVIQSGPNYNSALVVVLVVIVAILLGYRSGNRH